MIQAQAITKQFGIGPTAVYALKEVDLTIETGAFVSISGPSGCGKTTLLHVLSGIEEPTAGKVFIQDKDLYGLKETARSDYRLRHTGFIFQSFHLLPVLSALENVTLPLLGLGMSAKEAAAAAQHALGLVGLPDKLKSRPSQLSGGQNQRVAIARAIASRPAVLWADEPTGALDTDTSQQIVGLLRQINLTLGTTIVMVTHDPGVAQQTDRIIRMANGRILPAAAQEAP